MDDEENGRFGGVEWRDGLPTRSVGQSCAVCSATRPEWIHPLDPELVRFRKYGKGHTLPKFWTLCSRCETLYQSEDFDALVSLKINEFSEWSWTAREDIDECVRQPLRVFQRSDLGARQLPA